MADVSQTAQQPGEVGPGGVPKGAQTSQYYRTNKIPGRFDNPDVSYNTGNPVFSCNTARLSRPVPPVQNRPAAQDWFEGYSSKFQHPMYRTSNADYGSRPPSVHTMPTSFHAKSQEFSEHLGSCGMYRNHSLNCANDKSNVPDH